jgi:hypothetical protein
MAQEDWAMPKDTIDFPNLDIGHYPLIEGAGNCHRCLSLSRKSLYATEDPDCRVLLFENAPRGDKNIVKMAKAGGCYQDNPADYVHLMGLHGMQCLGFV